MGTVGFSKMIRLSWYLLGVRVYGVLSWEESMRG